jgi:hypothetical protein
MNTDKKSRDIIDELLQKIKRVLSCGNEAQAGRIIEQFIHYQEELTIDFTIWVAKNYPIKTTTANNEVMSTDGIGGYYTTRELYDIFKRERALIIHNL